MILWRGYHSLELQNILLETWEGGELTILCPPNIDSFSFLSHVPAENIEFRGEWSEVQTNQALSAFEKRHHVTFPALPILGVFTSGTLTGTPQLVLYSKQNILSSLEAVLSVFDRSRIQKIFCYPQAFHTFGLTLGYMLSIYLKIEIKTFFGKYCKASHALRADMKEANLLTIGTPTHFYDLIEYVRTNDIRLAESYSSIVGGAIVSIELWQKLRDVLNISEPSVGYGCTEASPAISHLIPGQVPHEDGEIGFPLANLKSVVTDKGVEISGDSLCLAIIYKNEITFPSQLIIPDSIEVRTNGSWNFRGRLDWVINRGGVKFSPELLETLIRAKLDLISVCMGKSDKRLGQDIAILVCETDLNLRARHFLHIQQLFESQFGLKLKADQVQFESNLPLNSSGKVDRQAVRAVLTK